MLDNKNNTMNKFNTGDHVICRGKNYRVTEIRGSRGYDTSWYYTYKLTSTNGSSRRAPQHLISVA